MSEPATDHILRACPECGRQSLWLTAQTYGCGQRHVWHIEAGRRVPGPKPPEASASHVEDRGPGEDTGRDAEAACRPAYEAAEASAVLRLARDSLAYFAAGGPDRLTRPEAALLDAEMDRLYRAAGERMRP